jgi:predicted glycosyltransferase/glycosyltransferase involved in cell wall biosynthesis
VFLYSHDTFGLGHLRRNLAIAEQLLAPELGCEVWLLSGSPVLRNWDLPAGLWVQPLPPVVKVGAERYAARSGSNPFALVKGYREALLLNTVMRERPDVILVDHAPAGMKNELLPMLAAVRQEMPRTRVVLGLRDIIDSPDVVCKLWQDEEIYGLLEHAYDDILVYGSRALFDVADAYRLPPAIAAKLHYVGYVVRPASPVRDAGWPGMAAASGLRVLVTAGGGGDGCGMMSGYLAALAALPEHTTASLLVPGPLMPPDQAEALARMASGRQDVSILPFTTDLVKLLAQAELVVAMGGYNTTAEILAARKNAIIVPRAAPRAEQLMRAHLLERLGVVWVAEDGPGLAQRLTSLLPQVLTGAAATQPNWDAIDLNGARRTAETIVERAPAPVFAPTLASPAGTGGRRIAYVMKRYPRLSETFILNEICAMEKLGEQLEIFSLLPPEPPPHHPTVAQVRASLTYLPLAWPAKLVSLARGHAAALATAPGGYGRAFAHALRMSLGSRAPLSVWRQFFRAGFFSTEARRRGITHIHSHFANAPSAVAHLVSLMTGLPFSFTTHAKDLYLTPPHLIAGRVRAASFITTCTQYNIEHLRGMLPREDHGKLNLVYHGIDLTRFRYRAPCYAFAAQGTPPLILCVARLVAKKGLDDLVAACGALAAQGVPFRCRIIGAGPLQPMLAADIAARGLGDMISLDGAMTHDSLIELFRQADLFALAPRIADDGDRDGIPNVIVEAMATGVPVVSSAVSGIPELVEHQRTGLLVEPNDPAALAAAMARLLGDPALGRRLAATARARLERCFDCWQNTQALRGLVVGLVCEAVEPSPRAVEVVA